MNSLDIDNNDLYIIYECRIKYAPKYVTIHPGGSYVNV